MNDIIKIEKNLTPIGAILLTNDFLDNFDNLSTEDITKLIIEIDIKAFYYKGKALQYVKENKRYKDMGYKTFESYTKDVLGFSKTHANRLLGSSLIYEELTPIGVILPTSESQLRPLIDLKPEQQVEVWKEVAKDKVPTAKEVQMAVNRISGTTKIKKMSPIVHKTESSNETFLDEINSLKNQLDKALAENTLLNTAIVECVDNERKLLEKIELLTLHISKFEGKESPAQKPQKDNVLLREDAFNFIMRYGSALQKMAITNTNPDNEKMFTYFCGTRRDFLAKNPPSALPENIRNAKSIG